VKTEDDGEKVKERSGEDEETQEKSKTSKKQETPRPSIAPLTRCPESLSSTTAIRTPRVPRRKSVKE
jgi:hypothetical protein